MQSLGGKPDFIIGNYSDGNMVASLLSHYMNVTQCNIAHALEKTKYNDADIHWCACLHTPFHTLRLPQPRRIPANVLV